MSRSELASKTELREVLIEDIEDDRFNLSIHPEIVQRIAEALETSAAAINRRDTPAQAATKIAIEEMAEEELIEIDEGREFYEWLDVKFRTESSAPFRRPQLEALLEIFRSEKRR